MFCVATRHVGGRWWERGSEFDPIIELCLNKAQQDQQYVEVTKKHYYCLEPMQSELQEG